MNGQRRVVWRWLACAVLVVPGFVVAQNLPVTLPSISAAQCAALTVLAPDPQKVSQSTVQAAAIAAVKAAAVPKPTQELVELAANAAAKAASAAMESAAFKLPQPRLAKGSKAEWGSRIELKFDAVGPPIAKCLESELILFLHHLPLNGLTPVERQRNSVSGVVTLVYRMNRPAASSAGWNELLEKLWKKDGSDKVAVGVGIGGTEIAVADETLDLTLGSGGPSWAWWALVASVIALAAFWSMSNLLTDRIKGHLSYSVSRLLLSLWVLTTVSAVLLMVLRLGVMPSATESGFAFMLAISGATTGFSALIDIYNNQRNNRTNPSETWFWEDFLDDADGLAIHRVQVVFFNLLILYIVWRDLIQLGSVARIDTGWAVLMGASAMTFVFGKAGETVEPSKGNVQPEPFLDKVGNAFRRLFSQKEKQSVLISTQP